MIQCDTCGTEHIKAQVTYSPGLFMHLSKICFKDIDGIKIRSDSEGGATKRTYNYRVSFMVQIPGHSGNLC